MANRLCDESLYPYPGRSDQQAVELTDGGLASENTDKQAALYRENRHSERSEVSRSHSSQMPIVMDGTG